MFKRIIATLTLGITSIFIAISILALVGSVHPTGFQFSYQAHAITAKEQNLYAQNNILFYNDECVPAGNATLNSGGGINIADGGFKIDGSVDAKDFWYAEGCLNNGECTGHVYADGDTYINANPFLYNVTKVDHDFGDLQYIYAENYDINYDVWPPKFTEKTGPKSDRKYYWIVLPAYAYTNGLGETYVAKFENLSEPVYFITFDAHACQHQSQSYCHTCGSGWCVDDPDNTLIGKEFLGAFEQAGGDYTKVAQKTGKLTYFHRIAGRGEVLVHETANGGGFAVGGDSSSSGTSGTSGATVTTVSGVTTTTYTTSNGKSATIAFPIAGVSKAIKNQVSTLPCSHPVGCHYGPGTQGGLKDAALDLCMGDNCKDQPVVSITDGTITRDIQTTRNGAQCNHVRIKSDIDNTIIAYMHLAYEDLGLHAGDHVSAGQLIGHIDWGSGAAGAGPCNDNSMAHVHIDKGTDTNATGGPSEDARDPELVKMINAAYDALPASGTAGSSSISSSTCITPGASGDLDTIKTAKNANQSVFDTDQYGQWGANWDDNDTAGLKRALETYGDLAYQTGKAIGAPWKAIFAQMRYEDPGSVCGKNNFWGMGCPPGTTKGNGSNYDTLGDGFIGYANYATKICNGAQNVSDKSACEASLKVSDPLQYLKNLGPLWVQGDANGQGYWFIDAIQSSLKKLDAFLATDEGKAIVSQFGNYSGDAGSGFDPSKVKYPQIDQQTGHTCGPASMAMLSSAVTGKTISESDIVSIVGSDRAYEGTRDGIVDLDKKVGEKYGFEVEGVAVDESNLQGVADKMREYLNKGYMIHFSGEGCTISSTCRFHYVGIFYLDGDTAYIADSSGAPASNRRVNLNDYITGKATHPKNGNAGGGFHGGYFSAIKGKTICYNFNSNGISLDPCDGVGGSNSGGNNGGSGDVNSSINADSGLTFEQAKEFAKKFGEIGNAGAEVVAPATWCYTTSGQHLCSTCKGGPGSDCTAVPYFFTGALTDLNFDAQSTQAGNFTASDIASRANVGRGTTPKVWSVVSAVGVHTWMIVGHHNGKWITIESSCSDNGNGAGTGEYGGGGVAWAAEIDDNAATTSVFSNMVPKEYAYLDGHVDLNKVSSFISGGYAAIK